MAYVIVGVLDRTNLRTDHKQALVTALILACALLVIRVHVRTDGPPWSLAWVADMVEGLFGTLIVLPPDLLAILVVLVAWWRGIVASRKELDIQQVWFRFRLGVILLLAIFLIGLFGQHLDLTSVIFAFFFSDC